jgi:hypothetical protein
MGEVRGIVAVRVERLSADSPEAPDAEVLDGVESLGVLSQFGGFFGWGSGSGWAEHRETRRACTHGEQVAFGKKAESHALPQALEGLGHGELAVSAEGLNAQRVKKYRAPAP